MKNFILSISIIVFFFLYATSLSAQALTIPTTIFINDSNMVLNDAELQYLKKNNNCVIQYKHKNCTLKIRIPMFFLDGVDSTHLYMITSENKKIYSKCNVIKRYTAYKIRGIASIERCLKCYDNLMYPQIPKMILFSSRKE